MNVLGNFRKEYSGKVNRGQLFFILIILIYAAINFYIGWHGYWLLSFWEIPLSAYIYWILFWVIAFSYLIGRLSILPGRGRGFFKVLGSYYFAVLEFSFILLPIIDLSVWIFKQTGFNAAPFISLVSVIFLGLLLLFML